MQKPPRPLPPRHRLDRCGTCGKRSNLTECPTCRQQVYCSTQCKERNKEKHKPNCFWITRMDLSRLHVYLACLADAARMAQGQAHPALHQEVISRAFQSHGDNQGEGAMQVLKLGRPLKSPTLAEWFPGASEHLRRRLWNRIASESDAIGLHVAMALCLLSQLYPLSTVGIELAGKPIADYGVAFGAAPVVPRNRFVYIMDGAHILPGQNPAWHGWLYFTNTMGQTATFDACMNAFGCGLMVSTSGFWTGSTEESARPKHVPVVWRPDDKGDWYNEARRVSVLHHKGLLRAAELLAAINDPGRTHADPISIMQNEIKTCIEAYVLELTGIRLGPVALHQIMQWAGIAAIHLGAVIRENRWYRWPDHAEVAFDYNPEDDDEATKLAKEFTGGKAPSVSKS